MTQKLPFPFLEHHATHPSHPPKPPKPLVSTKFKCTKCGSVWIAEFPTPIRETAYKQKRMGYECNECGFGWAFHQVLGPEPEVVTSTTATQGRRKRTRQTA